MDRLVQPYVMRYLKEELGQALTLAVAVVSTTSPCPTMQQLHNN